MPRMRMVKGMCVEWRKEEDRKRGRKRGRNEEKGNKEGEEREMEIGRKNQKGRRI